MAQVCQIRDDSGLSGGRELAQGAWLQDIRCVIDDLRGLAEALRTYPVQHCQFRQMMTVRNYLTGNPDIEVRGSSFPFPVA